MEDVEIDIQKAEDEDAEEADEDEKEENIDEKSPASYITTFCQLDGKGALPKGVGIDSLAFIRSQRGAPLLVNDGFVYRCERKSSKRTYWLCVGYKRHKCNARIICEGNRFVKATMHYNHGAEADRIERGLVEYRSLASTDRNDFLNSVLK